MTLNSNERIVLENLIARKKPASVSLGTWRGSRIYILTSHCCDRFNSAYYSETGEFIAAVSGGITGKGDRKYPNFYKEYREIETIIL